MTANNNIIRRLYKTQLLEYASEFREISLCRSELEFQYMHGFLKYKILSGQDVEYAANMVGIDVKQARKYFCSEYVQEYELPRLRRFLALKLAFCNVQSGQPPLLLYTNSVLTILDRSFLVPGLLNCRLLQALPDEILRDQHCAIVRAVTAEDKTAFDNVMSADRHYKIYKKMPDETVDELITFSVYMRKDSDTEESERYEALLSKHRLPQGEAAHAIMARWDENMGQFESVRLFMHFRRAQTYAMLLVDKIKQNNLGLAGCSALGMVLTIALSSAFNSEDDHVLRYAICERYALSPDTIYSMVMACHSLGFFFDPTDKNMQKAFSVYPLTYFVRGNIVSIPCTHVRDRQVFDASYPWQCTPDVNPSIRNDLDRKLLAVFIEGNCAPTHNEAGMIRSLSDEDSAEAVMTKLNDQYDDELNEHSSCYLCQSRSTSPDSHDVHMDENNNEAMVRSAEHVDRVQSTEPSSDDSVQMIAVVRNETECRLDRDSDSPVIVALVENVRVDRSRPEPLPEASPEHHQPDPDPSPGGNDDSVVVTAVVLAGEDVQNRPSGSSILAEVMEFRRQLILDSNVEMSDQDEPWGSESRWIRPRTLASPR